MKKIGLFILVSCLSTVSFAAEITGPAAGSLLLDLRVPGVTSLAVEVNDVTCLVTANGQFPNNAFCTFIDPSGKRGIDSTTAWEVLSALSVRAHIPNTGSQNLESYTVQSISCRVALGYNDGVCVIVP